MQCPRCQHENPLGTKFCGECAAPLAAVCPSCGAPNPSENKFCGQCAAPLRTAPTTKFTTPDSYTPKHLVEKILTSKAALEGERKQVTVLFGDLKGSMELLADRDPEEARKLLDPVLEHMMEAVHRYEGTVNQVMGDGIMALFGAPLAHEDHALRACYAALRMQDSVARYAEEAFRAQGVRVQIRVGLNSGEVVVRAIGSDLHMDYTAVEQTTHLAARMEQMAAPGTILLAPATLRLAEDHVLVAALGQATVKGLPDPVDIHVLTGASARTRLQAGIERGLTPFVGRDPEIEQLHRGLNLARDGHGQLVAVVGEPGVGKSRLLHEFMRSVRDQGWLILEAGAVSYGKATSYLPVISLFKTYCQIDSQDDTRKIQEKVTDKLLTLDRALEPTLSVFFSLLDVPVDDAQWHAIDPPQRRQRTLDASKQLLLRESRAQPLLLLFEDLHWIDSETQALLDTLTESLPTARLLLLVNYRPEYQHNWGSKTFYTQVRVDSLPADRAEDLLQALLGNDEALRPLGRLLVEQTQGNPFFLEECVRTLVETNVLAGERGAYRLITALPSIQVPATVQAVLASRIDRLAPDEKRLLQTGAVLGRHVPLTLLQAIAQEPEDRVRVGLARLQAAEFLYELRLFPEPEYTFKHALTHEVAYGSLLRERRRILHASIVEAIEALQSERLAEHSETLADHAFRGEVWSKAAVYLRQAGVRAMGRSALREAVTWFDQALTALSHLGEAQTVQEQVLDIRFHMRTVLLQLGQRQPAIDNLLQAVALATALDDQPRLARACAFLVTSYVFAGDYSRAADCGHRVEAIAETSGNALLSGEMDYRFGQIHYGTGDYQGAIMRLRRNLYAVPADTASLTAFNAFVFWRVYLGLCLAELGDFAEGLRFLNEALPPGRASALPFDLAGVDWGLGLLHIRQGDLARARPILEDGFNLCQAKSLHLVEPIIGSLLGLAHCGSGLFETGIPLLEECAKTGDGIFPFSSQVAANVAEGYLMARRLQDAHEAAMRALDIAVAHSERGHEGWAHRLLGDISADSYGAPPDGPAAHYQAAHAIGNPRGMRPLVAHCHLGLGKLYRQTRDSERAKQHLTTATTMYRDMGMTFWLEQADKQMKEVM
jgi:class 3 adenylate cyclase/tetratricopeptide (TPR) repeat protein